MDVDLTIAQGFEHVAGDLLAVIKVETRDANQGHIGFMDHPLAANFFMDLLGDFQCFLKIFFFDANKDVIIFLTIKQVHDQLDMNTQIGDFGEIAATNAWVGGDSN